MDKIQILPAVTAELNAIRDAVEDARLSGSCLLNNILLRIDTAEKIISDLNDKFNAFFDQHFQNKGK